MKKIVFVIMLFATCLIQAQTQGDTEKMLLETMGALSGQNMYLTYLSLGNIADTYASGIYKNEFAAELADELTEMIKKTNKQYNDLLASNKLFGDDYNAILKFVDVYNALLEESQGLKNMIVLRNKENIGQYESGRQKAWTLISEILGIQNPQ